MDKDHTFNIYSLIKIILFFIVISLKFVFSQQVKLDTLHLKAGSQIEFINSVINFSRDTVITIPSGSKYIIYDAPDSTSDNFYKKLDTYSKKINCLNYCLTQLLLKKRNIKK